MGTEDEGRRTAWTLGSLVPLLLALLVLTTWLAVKAVLFRHLEYVCDLFQHLVMSRSVFEGHPFLWEPQAAGLLHNYPLLPSFYALTAWLGAYGLFVGLAAWTAGALVAVWRLANRSEPWRRELYWTIVFALVLGPVGFWLWDDPTYGWHTQMVFVPLGILFATCLITGTRLAWVAAALIVLNREEGALIAWAIHVLFVTMGPSPDGAPGPGRWWAAPQARRVLLITAVYALAFGANMAWLLARQPSIAGSRIGVTVGQATSPAWADPAARGEIASAVLDIAWLLLSGLVITLAGLRPARVARVAVVIVPLVATGMIGMLAYATGGPMRYHGLAWPPRFVMVWTVFVAACLFAAAFARRPRFASRATRLAVCVAVGLASVAAQHLALKSRRDYDGAARIATVALRRSELASGALTMKEEAVLRCLGARLPRGTLVKAPAYLDGRFHRQTPLADWPEAQLVVCDVSPRQRWPIAASCADKGRIVTATGQVATGELWIAYEPGLKPVVDACVPR